MISSEVQRTLVKSPPELWAEISDPEALARHLGEFGEIRITRVQPEQKVEWEANDATGSIVIKPSGWGTKVKLTVTRELSETEDEAEIELGAESGDPAETGEASAIGERAAADETQGPHTAPAAGAGDETAAVEAAAAEPVAPPTDTLAREDTADATELEEACEQTRDELEGDPLEEPAHEDTPQPEPEPERRRGFFARLFGRRRATPSAGVAGGDEPVAPVTTSDDGHASEAQLGDGDYEQPAIVAAETVDAGRLDEDTSSPLLVAEEELASNAETGLDAGPPSAPASDAAGGRADARQSGGASEHPSPDEHSSPDEPAATLAADLEQAEETAAEQVTAVLTGVLDRLGAAHHRPFSRA